jgi:hypothetical protein
LRFRAAKPVWSDEAAGEISWKSPMMVYRRELPGSRVPEFCPGQYPIAKL